jgi:hypothetical protein
MTPPEPRRMTAAQTPPRPPVPRHDRVRPDLFDSLLAHAPVSGVGGLPACEQCPDLACTSYERVVLLVMDQDMETALSHHTI